MTAPPFFIRGAGGHGAATEEKVITGGEAFAVRLAPGCGFAARFVAVK